MRPALVVALVIVALAAAVYVAYTSAPGQSTPTPTPTEQRTPTPVPSATARSSPSPTPTAPGPSPTPVDTSVRASAVVVPIRSADLAMSISGLVNGVYVDENEDVVANQILVRLDQSTYLAAINVAQASVTRAEAALERAQLTVDQLPPDASPGQIESAQAELRLAAAELALARSTLSDAQNDLEQTELRAPFAGTVADVSIEVGEQAVAGQPLVSIGDTSTWLIETTDLTELQVVRVAVGDSATMTFSALPGMVATGRVDRIQVRGTTADGGVRYAVSILPDQRDARLRWGMSAQVRISPTD